MADFCQQCSTAIFGEDYGDMAGIATGDTIRGVICEGCGPTYVDAAGACVNLKCLEKHGTKHAECSEACQQAVQYGVWPEHSCDPRCVWKRYKGNPLNEPPTEREKQAAQDEVRRAVADVEQNIKMNEG